MAKPFRVSGPRASRKPVPEVPVPAALRLRVALDLMAHTHPFLGEELTELRGLIDAFGAEQFNRGFHLGAED